MYLMYVGLQLWISIEEIPFTSQKVVDGISVKKPPNERNDNEIKNVSYDLKVRNILFTSLSVNYIFNITL